MIYTNPPSGSTELNPAPSKPGRWQRFWAFPVTRIALYLLVFLSIMIALALVTGVASAVVLSIFRLLHRHVSPQELLKNQVLLMTIGEGIAAASALLAFWFMAQFIDKRPWATAGYNRQGLMTGLFGGFALGTAMLSMGVGVLAGLGAYHVTALVPSVLVLVPLLLYFCVGVFEETFFRGYIFQTLEGRWGSGVALGATSLLFGLAHLTNPVPGASHWMRVAGPLQICLEAGLPIGAAYLLTRRWWLPIGMHWAWDYFEGPIYGCPDSGNHDSHTLLHAVLSGPQFVSGGPFGPEAGVVFLAVGTLTGALLLRAAVQRGQWQARPRRAK